MQTQNYTKKNTSRKKKNGENKPRIKYKILRT